MPGLFKSKSTSKTSQTQNQKTEAYDTGPWKDFSDVLRQFSQGRLESGGLPAGYEQSGLSRINQAYSPQQQNLSNILSARGLSRSPVAGLAETNLAMNRAGDVGRFRAGLPVLERQLADQDFSQAMRLYGMAPKGQTSTGSMTGQSEQTTSPSMFSSLMSVAGLAAGLGGFGGAASLLGGGGGASPPVQGAGMPGYQYGQYAPSSWPGY